MHNKIDEEYDYNFNDTATLRKDKAKVNNETYESPKNERRDDICDDRGINLTAYASPEVE